MLCVLITNHNNDNNDELQGSRTPAALLAGCALAVVSTPLPVASTAPGLQHLSSLLSPMHYELDNCFLLVYPYFKYMFYLYCFFKKSPVA